ncbi:MAG: AAA family ATPase [Alphaproteobacteria bacterium]|nr:AAA family ATPase [Alphaproteobacteria bacterium]
MKEFILPCRDLVVHPDMTVPIYVDNPTSISCVDIAAGARGHIVLAPQHSMAYPSTPEDLYEYGTIGDIAQVLHMPDGTIHTIIRTTNVVKLDDISVNDGVFSAQITEIPMGDDIAEERTIRMREKIFETVQAMSLFRKVKIDKLRSVIQNYPLPAFIDSISQTMGIDLDTVVKILVTPLWYDKLVLLFEQVRMAYETAKVEDSINRRISAQMEQGRREAILQEKMRAIQKEMGEDDGEADTVNMRKKIEKSAMPDDVKEKAITEWKRMRNMSPMSNEGGLIKTYLEELLAMPWGKSEQSDIDLNVARKTLDSEHSGMRGVKERILEHIAVMKKTGSARGGILCFVGAPGVGKTSLCKSIATALGRKYHRISLGGVSDEAHFRGHRKTYIGSQPGRIMDALKRTKVNNPVIVLDEIDKMGRDWRGDPESALLEVLDPEQNKAFRDHYLEVDFDLSNVMFIATANSLNLSGALKDRMEIIEIPGYSEDEKVQIAREHLIARAAMDTGWNPDNIDIKDDAIRHIIRKYTAESGVRQLQRELTAVLRRTLLENNGEDAPTEFTIEKIDGLLSLRQSAGFSKRIGFGVSI